MAGPPKSAYGLNPMYRYTVIAEDGQALPFGKTISSIEPYVSVNESGHVAFIARIDQGDQLLVGWNELDPFNVSQSPNGRNFDFPQINNQNRIVTRELLSGNSLIRVWNLHNPAAYQVIASTTLSAFSQVTIPTIGNMDEPVHQYITGFLGREGDLPFNYWANDTGMRDTQDRVAYLSGTALARFRAKSAHSNRRTFVAQYQSATVKNDKGRIVVFSDPDDSGLWDNTAIATTVNGDWLELSNSPGISDTARVVAFIGDHWKDGPGLYLAVADTRFNAGFDLERILDLDDPIAIDENNQPITFESFDYMTPVGVIHQYIEPLSYNGDTGECRIGRPTENLEADSIVIVFAAKPERASRPNPTLQPAEPFFFSEQPGIWTIRVDIERDLDPDVAPAKRELRYHARGPIPVAQEGDVVGGKTIQTLTLYDPLAIPERDVDLRPREVSRWDHYAAFAALTTDGVKVVRAALLDTDEDGLMDHWETGGIDMDEDGHPELALPAMGADPLHKDVFLEVDWTNDRTVGGHVPWTNVFPPFTAQGMADMFANATWVCNPDGIGGVTLHVDAGPDGRYAENPASTHPNYGSITFIPNSVNMGTDLSLLQGGDKVGLENDPTAHLDLVYFGVPFGFEIPGAKARALHDIKDHHFGDKDQWAREFAFKYNFLSDFLFVVTEDEFHEGQVVVTDVESAATSSVTGATAIPDYVGKLDFVIIVGGTGAGQTRMILDVTDARILDLKHPWDVIPDATSSMVFMQASVSGVGEMFSYDSPAGQPQDNHSQPGNDFLVGAASEGVNDGGWLGNYKVIWRLMNHEFGHTFALRHGGSDHVNDKPDYFSIMNYLYLDENRYDTYSDWLDPVFDDWSYLKYDFQQTKEHFGNSFHVFPGPDPPDPLPNPPDPPSEERTGKPPDLKRPVVVITAPDDGERIPYEDDLTVLLIATDETELAAVYVVFDKDGDGVVENPHERMAATHIDGNQFSATFETVDGPFNTREIMGLAFDASGNIGADVRTVVAGDVTGAETTLHQAEGDFPAQAGAGDGGERQKDTEGPLSVPGSGRLTFTVTSAPPVRAAGVTEERYDSTVSLIRFEGKDIQLMAVCNPPGSDPAICTSYWRAPKAGSLNVEILGPAVYDSEGQFVGHSIQHYELTVTFEAVDITPPVVSVTSPGAGGFAEITRDLDARISATDDYAIATVEVAFDIDGDGSESGSGEKVGATDLGDGKYKAIFPSLNGESGPRPLRVTATDTAGLVKQIKHFVDVRVPDTTAPTLSISSPPAGWPLEQGATLALEINAYDEIEVEAVTAAFDINGDGDRDDPGESVTADRIGANLFGAEFQNISGPNGSRTVNLSTADTAGNTSQASLPVTIGGVVLETETVFTDNGHIDAQSSAGSQLTIDYDPVTLSGSGTVVFKVTASPSVRARGQNIPRKDPYVKDISLNGEAYNLNSSLVCNAWNEPTSVCSTTFEAEEGGSLDFSILGPKEENIWGEFVGHPAQDYTIVIKFTPVDITAPEITIVSPGLGANLDLGSSVSVSAEVSDGLEVASVVVSFDSNGDGDLRDLGEQVAASHSAGIRYQADFGALSGAPGNRRIEILAMDTSFNSTTRSITVGVGGVGAGEEALLTQASTIPGQGSEGSRQVLPFGPFDISGVGRLTFRVTATPSTRALGTNLPRHDPQVVSIDFAGQKIFLTPECNSWDSDPAVCVSVWDTPGPGTLNFEILGAATYNTWGEFSGSPEQDYTLDVLFLPGPAVTEVSPATGSTSGQDIVTVRGSGFGYNAVVLFGGVPGTDVSRVSAEELTCSTPPGVAGSATVTVLNTDPDQRPWNYGVPYGLFGRLEDGFTYQESGPPSAPKMERLLGTWKGHFNAVGRDGAQEQQSNDVTIPAAGQLRFEAWAFIPILNPIPGPFENPDNLEWHNESTAVRRVAGGDGSGHWAKVEYSDLGYAYGPVISNATVVVLGSDVGSGSFTLKGPAQWNAFELGFGNYVMQGAPAQHWSLAVWFADQPILEGVFPASGLAGGGTPVTLTGKHFFDGMDVRFGGNLATDVVVQNASTVSCRAPKGSAGPVSVAIELLEMTASLPNGYTYLADTDSDSISDTVEDASACLDSNDADTDDDGVPDGVEDANQNGSVDPGETDPCNRDTDGDGIQDGTELGYTADDIGSDTDTDVFQPDLAPESGTDPLKSDSDGDGFTDGDEDSNHNGRVDAGEDDPDDVCPNSPVRIGEPPLYYDDIQSAYNDAMDGDILEVHGIVSAEDLEFDRDITVTLKGGYSCGYSASRGMTRIGSAIILRGSVTVRGLALE